MAKTAVLNAADMTLAGVAKTKAEIAAIVGDTPDNFVLVTNKTFEASEQHPTFGEMCGEEVVVKAEAVEGEVKARKASETLTGEYHIAKPPQPVAPDHGRAPFIDAILANTDVDAAKAACPEKTPRAKNGFFTFGSEFRYLITRGVVVMGAAPAVEAAE